MIQKMTSSNRRAGIQSCRLGSWFCNEMSNWIKHGFLFAVDKELPSYMGFTIKPLWGSLLTNQYSIESSMCFFRCSDVLKDSYLERVPISIQNTPKPFFLWFCKVRNIFVQWSDKKTHFILSSELNMAWQQKPVPIFERTTLHEKSIFTLLQPQCAGLLPRKLPARSLLKHDIYGRRSF